MLHIKYSHVRNIMFFSTPCFFQNHIMTLLVGHLFKIYVSRATSSVQYSFDKHFYFNMLLAISMIILFFFSLLPFFEGCTLW
jgi:predicted membrane protein